jgi:hypothetical protein
MTSSIVYPPVKFSRINPVWFLFIYIFLNLYKPLIGIIFGRESITAISIVISISLCLFYFLKDLTKYQIGKKKALSFLTLFLLTLHLLFSMVFIHGANFYPALVSYFQIVTPMIILFILESLEPHMVSQLSRFLVVSLIPFIVFAFIEILLPISLRIQLYMGFSRLVTGESQIDVAYYLGDTAYGGLRLGSLFFEPLTFAFVSTFLTIYLFSKKKKFAFPTLLTNVLSLGKLPIATTFIAIGAALFKRLYRLYYVFVFALIIIVLVYFIRNAEEIAIDSPSLGSHMVGLAYGLINTFEAPFMGHGFGTAGYLSFVYYKKMNEEGPFTKGIGGLMNGNESAVGSISYQLGYFFLLLFLLFFIVYFIRLVKARQHMMASGVIGFLLSLFLSESVLSITVVSVLLIFSKSLLLETENKIPTDH